MALEQASLEKRIINEFTQLGASPNGPHSWVNKMAKAIAKAVVDEIQANAKVTVNSGSSAGEYPVK